ncbi:MAG TPA: hypothetical protein VLH56_10630 [Dissulfurispiraceae bacterium]|nr:hypothetical protein [Dissulfurispiraceae bacterium]
MHRKLDFIKDISDKFTGKAHLYRVDPPVEYLLSEESSALTPFVVASAPALSLREPRVYLFPANEAGNLLDWTEIMTWKNTADIDAVMREWGKSPFQKLAIKASA